MNTLRIPYMDVPLLVRTLKDVAVELDCVWNSASFSGHCEDLMVCFESEGDPMSITLRFDRYEPIEMYMVHRLGKSINVAVIANKLASRGIHAIT